MYHRLKIGMKALKMKLLLLITLLVFGHAAHAEEHSIPDSFKINGEFINPQCVEQLQTWISESDSIIVQSIVLDTCQDSNLAFEGRETFYQNGNEIGYTGDADDAHDDFSYTYQASLSDNKHILSHGSDLVLYEIMNKRLAFDVAENDFRDVHVLSIIGSIGYFHCFKSAEISENTLTINRRVYYPENPRATACDDNKTEQIKVDLRDVL